MGKRVSPPLLLVILLLGFTNSTKALPLNPVIFPTNSIKVSSPFGKRIHPIRGNKHLHSGIHIAAPLGSNVRAIQGGKVVFASQFGGYGNLITVFHGDGISSLYGHLSKVSVEVGNEVMAGEVIGKVGMSGNTTGPHLHFEIRIGGVPIDPEGVWD